MMNDLEIIKEAIGKLMFVMIMGDIAIVILIFVLGLIIMERDR